MRYNRPVVHENNRLRDGVMYRARSVLPSRCAKGNSMRITDTATTVEEASPEMPAIEPVLQLPAASAHDLRGRVVGLAAPVIGENLLQTLLGVVDTILVAGLGAVALAGVGTALQVIF